MITLGVYCGHDANACIVKDGEVIVNIEKERLTRRKGDVGNADSCIQYCLRVANIKMDDVDYVATSRAGDLNYSHSVTILTGEIYSNPNVLYSCHDAITLNTRKPTYFIQHHIGHSAAAFYNSGFKEAAILSVDGWGDFTATLLAFGDGKGIHPIEMPNCNIGMVWMAFCTTLGFSTRHSEGTLMALASYGKPRYSEMIREWCGTDWRTFRIQGKNRTYDEALQEIWHGDIQTVWDNQDRGVKFQDTEERWYGIPLFRGLVKENPLHEKNRDIAASLQKVTEDILCEAANELHKCTRSENLCIAGGVALNCVANSQVLRNTNFRRVFITPATHDGGLSVGSALYLYHAILKNPGHKLLSHPYFGNSYSDQECLAAAIKTQLPFMNYPSNGVTIEERTAELLSQGKIVAWFQGGSEMGPRALGHRSILCDPRLLSMKDILNSRIKHRASFRPYAPSVLEEKVSDVFDWKISSPFMLFASTVRPEYAEKIPAVLHVDGTARIQTVNKDNGAYYSLIQAFYRKTGVPLLLNTSFNDAGEPIVESPDEAVQCFLKTEIDCLVLNTVIVYKNPDDIEKS